MKTRIFLVFFCAIFLSACSSSKVNAFLQTNNEGIFIQTTQGRSVYIDFQNPSKLSSNLQDKLKIALEQKGFVLSQDKNQAEFEILLNLVDFRKLSYAQRMDGRRVGFFYGPFMEIDYEYQVENYYIMQANVQILQNKQSRGQTSLLARTAYATNLKACEEALEDKIVAQILSFFYF